MKRNASAFVVPRNHSHSALKKNYSSGHLPRNLSGKALNKAAQRAQPKRKHSGRSSEKSVPASPASPPAVQPQHQQPTVRFALADDEGGESEEDEENEWTEESASVSPNVTRDHTRNNSVVLEPERMGVGVDHAHEGATSGEESTNTVIHQPSISKGTLEHKQSEPAAAAPKQQDMAAVNRINGESSFQASAARPATLDADAITSRLLQRRAPSPSGSDAKVTHVSALVQSDSQDHRTLSHSQASTLADGTPGRDLVSRFVNANSTDGTPRDGDMLPQRKPSPPAVQERELDASKRNKSAPNFADRGPISPAHARSASRRSGTSTPTDLPPSRTQQKLLLQRASSALEPAKHIPAVLPRPGAAQLLGHGLSFTSSEGGTPAQIQALFSQINKEYNVVRRYRNPVADAVGRAREIPRSANGMSKDKRNGLATPSASTTNLRGVQAQAQAQARAKQQRRAAGGGENGTDGHDSPPPEESLRSHAHTRRGEQKGQAATIKREETRGHRSRVSFDLPMSVRAEDSEEDVHTGTPGSRGVNGMRRDETYDLLRRMWDMGEEGGVVAG